jgi:hypothetical protein
MPAKPKCVECGGTGDDVQHVSIAWPGEQPFYLNKGPIDPQRLELGDRYEPNPKVGRRFWSGWLHMECEMICVERIERRMQTEAAKK